MAKLKATWRLFSLNTGCPYCGEKFDLMDDTEFWVNAQFKVAESRTKATRDVEVVCPNCDGEFKVDFEY